MLKDAPFVSLLICLIFGSLTGCAPSAPSSGGEDPSSTEPASLAADVHSYARPQEAAVTHLDLDISVDFERKVISGTATYKVQVAPAGKEIRFDVNGIAIQKVTDQSGKELAHRQGEGMPHLGHSLTIPVDSSTEYIALTYETRPDAEALQWLEPQQTAGKKAPFLFTQSQAILARTWIPCQDGPGMRFTYNATVQVPPGMMAAMSAENPTEKSEDGKYSFSMKQPIPSYLMALAVGDFAFKPVGKRTGVYAEPSVMDKAVYEFGEMEAMLEAAEAMYGTYAWDRYDLIVLPPSFPFGGMENPRLTFATPTILAGDRSLTALVAHELAHSWSGNLVTNITWNDFWLNEGFTVYFERRIMEALYGTDYADMLAILGYQDLLADVQELGPHSEDTHLKLKLDGRNPDDGMTNIAYEKGYFFLRMVEETVGRDKFDPFLRHYFEEHAFKSMDTEGFVRYLKDKLVSGDTALLEELQIDAWVYGPGVPSNCPEITSTRFEQVNGELEKWTTGTSADQLATDSWTTHEWLHFLRKLPDTLSTDQLADLDGTFGFTQSGNSEVLAAWFVRAIPNHYAAADEAVEAFLISVGRRKFLTPIYKALLVADPSGETAKGIYKKARGNYHAVSVQSMDALLGWEEDSRAG